MIFTIDLSRSGYIQKYSLRRWWRMCKNMYYFLRCIGTLSISRMRVFEATCNEELQLPPNDRQTIVRA